MFHFIEDFHLQLDDFFPVFSCIIIIKHTLTRIESLILLYTLQLRVSFLSKPLDEVDLLEVEGGDEVLSDAGLACGETPTQSDYHLLFRYKSSKIYRSIL